MDELWTKLGDLIIEAGKVPWALKAIAIIIVAFLVGFVLLALYRIRKGDEVSLFWFITLKPNRYAIKLKAQFDILNEDAKQKTQVIKTMNLVSVEIAKALGTTSRDEYERLRKGIYEYLLYSIAVVLKKNRTNNHRVAIFVDNHDGYLRIHEGYGFSPDGKRSLRLKISDSAAGFVFTTAEVYNSGNVKTSGNKFRPHPNATKDIYSLVCVPIKCDQQMLGVLSIDGQEENSFTQDDLDYLTYFANALTSLMLMELIEQEEGGDNEQDEAEEFA